MPSLPFKSKSAKKTGDQESPDDNADAGNKTPPPAYAEISQHGGSSHAVGPPPPPPCDSKADITAAFSNLSLYPGPTDPTVEKCLAHLKLLHAFQSMKEDVGYTDGLWNIWDSRAESGGDIDIDEVTEPLPSRTADSSSGKHKRSPEDEKKIRLSKLREKRWALFVARAVDRYQAWWDSFTGGGLLRERDMAKDTVSAYSTFVFPTNYQNWTEVMLPPLDVLMV